MKIKAYDDGVAQLWLADARYMSFLEDGSVDCIVTSPPYWSLRKYGGGAELIWDAAEGCEHVWGDEVHGPGFWSSDTRPGPLQSIATQNREKLTGQFCQLCGAWRGQLGLEPTIELYLDHLLQITDTECGRVLKPGGVMVVNMGDSYASIGRSPRKESPGVGAKQAMPAVQRDIIWQAGGGSNFSWQLPGNLKPLDLCMIPARFALAMQQRGWYLRSIVPWLKQAAMPDSVQGDRWERHRVKVGGKGTKGSTPAGWDTQHESDPAKGPYDNTKANLEWVDCPGCPKCLPNDGLVRRRGNWRPGRSMEWLFLFSKTNDYYSDAEGVRKANVGAAFRGKTYSYGEDSDTTGGLAAFRNTPHYQNPAGRNRRESDWLYESLDAIIANHEREARRLKHLRDNGGMLWEDGEPLALLLNPKGYKEAHFATYPIAMVEPLITAYTSEAGNCPKCGMPWVRVVKMGAKRETGYSHKRADSPGAVVSPTSVFRTGQIQQTTTLGWRPDCDCEAERFLGENPWLFPRSRNPRKAKAQNYSTWLTWRQRVFNRIHREYQGELKSDPAIVLDPFVGSGTTCAAATKLGRRSIGVDCVEEYIALAIKRLGGPFTMETKEGVKVKQTGLWGGRER